MASKGFRCSSSHCAIELENTGHTKWKHAISTAFFHLHERVSVLLCNFWVPTLTLYVQLCFEVRFFKRVHTKTADSDICLVICIVCKETKIVECHLMVFTFLCNCCSPTPYNIRRLIVVVFPRARYTVPNSIRAR